MVCKLVRFGGGVVDGKVSCYSMLLVKVEWVCFWMEIYKFLGFIVVLLFSLRCVVWIVVGVLDRCRLSSLLC